MLKVKGASRNATKHFTANKQGPEEDSLWIGIGTGKLGLKGKPVSAADLARLLDARHPDSGVLLLPYNRAKRKQAWEFVFTAPKGISLAWGLQLNPARRAEILCCHDKAVADAVAFAEKHVAGARVSIGGKVAVVPASLTVATFRHTTNRNNEPHPHTHALVMNLALTEDGQWRSLAERRLYKIQAAVRAVYEASLRRYMAEAGYRFHDADPQNPALTGVAAKVAKSFSTRTTEIEHFMAGLQRDDSKVRDAAFLATRLEKEAHTIEELQAIWFARCEELGLDPTEIVARITEAYLSRGAYDVSDPKRQNRLLEEMLSGGGITEHRATFTRFELMKEFAVRCIDGATPAQIEELTDRFLNCDEVVPIHVLGNDGKAVESKDAVGHGTIVEGPASGGPMIQRYTLKSILALERSILDAAGLSPATTRSCQVARARVDKSLAEEAAAAIPPS